MKKTGLLLCILTLCCIASCFINLDRYKCSWTSPENVQFRAVQKLKHQIDTTKMITYLDKAYNVRISYPELFVATDTTPGTARFRFPNDSVNEIALTMLVEPNIEGWNIKEAVQNLSDSLNVCIEEGKDYFIMTGKFSDNPCALFLEKCFLIDDNWIDYTLYYASDYEEAIERLANLVKEWKPMNNNDIK